MANPTASERGTKSDFVTPVIRKDGTNTATMQSIDRKRGTTVLLVHRLEALNIRFHLFYNRESGCVRAFCHGDVNRSPPVEERVSSEDVGAVFDERNVPQKNRWSGAGADGQFVKIVNVRDH